MGFTLTQQPHIQFGTRTWKKKMVSTRKHERAYWTQMKQKAMDAGQPSNHCTWWNNQVHTCNRTRDLTEDSHRHCMFYHLTISVDMCTRVQWDPPKRRGAHVEVREKTQLLVVTGSKYPATRLTWWGKTSLKSIKRWCAYFQSHIKIRNLVNPPKTKLRPTANNCWLKFFTFNEWNHAHLQLVLRTLSCTATKRYHTLIDML